MQCNTNRYIQTEISQSKRKTALAHCTDALIFCKVGLKSSKEQIRNRKPMLYLHAAQSRSDTTSVAIFDNRIGEIPSGM